MSSYFLLILFFWIIVCLFDYGEFSYLIQLKEYRLDRFKDFISTKQGKKFLKGYLFLKRPLLVFILFHFSFDIIELKYIIFLLS